MPTGPPPLAIQPLLRSVRRLMRHPLMREVAVGDSSLMYRFTELFAYRYAFLGSEPRFAVARMERMVQSALRMVSNGRRPREIYKRYMAYILRAGYLQCGLFCAGIQPDDNFCSICQSNDEGDWWWSLKCDHCFHVKCIFECFAHDKRCPLCRGAMW
jgi:hypothetical protein